MEKYIGIGFVILCLSVLAGIVGILKYQFSIDKEKIYISPAVTNTNHSDKNNVEWVAKALTHFLLYYQ